MLSGGVVMSEALLKVQHLSKYFPVKKNTLFGGRRRMVKAVDDVSFTIQRGETVGLVGESGSGKSTVARLILRLLEPTAGAVSFAGQDIFQLDEAAFRPLRRHMQMVFQDPFSSLNPRRTAGEAVEYPLQIQGLGGSKRTRQQRVLELFQLVGLEPEFVNRYPHEFSGGQRQRVGLARALALEPQFLILDEPVSALDVSIQAQVLILLQELQQRLGLTYLFIAHDLNVVEHMSDRVMVMYLGTIVEVATAETLYHSPQHPYTRALLSANPELDPQASTRQRIILRGEIPSPLDVPSGCRFRTRCPEAMDICAQVEPQLQETGANRAVACHLMAR
jgi:oligopeptide/dipeptide ABC transporter ATP-binding protein